MINLDILKVCYRRTLSFVRPKKIIVKGNYSYVNWVFNGRTPYDWFANFIDYNLKNINKPIRFYSVFGNRRHLKENFPGIKIFFTPENLEEHIKFFKEDLINNKSGWFFSETYRQYNDFALKDMDLSIGYSEREENNYIRIPLWLIINFKPNSTYDDIKEKVLDINKSKNCCDAKNAVVIASHDVFGSRNKICKDIESIVPIVYAGKWKNSTNELWTKFKNDKNEYLRTFKFNICAENMDAPYYVTEKLFDAFNAGTVPVYHGASNNPEPQIINKNRIIFWDFQEDNYKNIKLLKRLQSDDNFYHKYAAQPKLLNSAPELIYDKFEELKKKLEIILK